MDVPELSHKVQAANSTTLVIISQLTIPHLARSIQNTLQSSGTGNKISKGIAAS